MRCPHCGSNRMPKDGRSRGKRTYRCGDCKYRCAPDGSRHYYYSSKVIDQALAIYAEGASVAAIGGAMEINEATALIWVKKALSSIRIMDAERSERKPAGSGLPASVRKIRGINTDTPQVNRLLRRLPKASLYRSDHYKAYSVLPLGSPDARLQQAAVHAGRVACDGAAKGRSAPTPARLMNTLAQGNRI